MLLMKKLYTLSFAILLISSNVFSQAKLDYSSKWFLGFNIGGTWQTTDVKNTLKMGTGYGLTFGKSFNYEYGKRISFDIRARYLYGNWAGQNTDSTSISSEYTGVLSQFGTNYKDSLGFSVNNFQTEVHRFALELVLHANGIKERSNWDPYIFGGIGATFHKTYGDLNNSNGLYAYDNLTTFNNSTVTSLLDKSYETPLDGTKLNTFRVNFMPSLGFGLGYQLTKRVSIGLEHKTTFTLLDDFDGVISASKYNDIYHYSGGYIKFNIRSGSENHRMEEDKVVIPPVNPVTTTSTSPQLPVVKFVNPSVTGHVVNSAAYTILADVNYVDGRNNIIFKQDGIENSNFTYNASTDRLESSVILKLGENVFEIKGTNIVGSDSKSTIVIYKRTEGTPPVVTITNPSTTSITVTTPVYNLTSTILNVQNASQVGKTFNGQSNTNFTFNPTTNILTTTLTLIEGTNTVIIKGTNTFGSDSKTVTIIYNKPIIVVPVPPVVTFITPNVDPYTSSTAQYNVSATVLNVTLASGIVVNMNGTNITNFQFNGSSSAVSFPANLIEGANSITITGTNTAGVDSEIQTIIYRKPAVVLPPVVTFITPNVNPYTSLTAQYNVSATVLNVTLASGIVVNMNGTNITNFQFNGSSSTVSFPANLIEGANSITITGTNTAGVDSEIQTIIYRKPSVVLPPVVTFITPNVNPYTSLTAQYNVSATVLNVTLASGIVVNMNGTNITNFQFNGSSSTVSFPANLIEGANSITITGTNTAGVDSEIQTIIYRKPAVVLPPVVTYVNPASSGIFVSDEAFNLIANITNIENINQVVVSKDGQNVNSTLYTFNSSTHKVSFNTILNEGMNTFIVTGTNSAGTSTESTSVIYRKIVVPCESPTITITSPKVLETASNSVVFTAKLENITSLNQIHFVLNGADITNGSFNPTTKIFTKSVMLIEGVNIFNIAVANECGSTKDQKNISYIPYVAPCVAPTITIISPTASETAINTVVFTAKLENITSLNQINFVLNGVELKDGTFNLKTKIFSKSVILKEGVNIFNIAVANECGSTKDQRNITFKPRTSEGGKIVPSKEIGPTSVMLIMN